MPDPAFEVVLPNGDRAEATDEGGILLAARTLLAEAVHAGAAGPFTKRGLHVYRNGIRDGALTRRAVA